MNGHTPGPWIVDGVGIHAIVRAVESRVIVAVRNRLNAAENEANMRLISASPAMLGVLQKLWMEADLTDSEQEMVRTAIFEATGENP